MLGCVLSIRDEDRVRRGADRDEDAPCSRETCSVEVDEPSRPRDTSDSSELEFESVESAGANRCLAGGTDEKCRDGGGNVGILSADTGRDGSCSDTAVSSRETWGVALRDVLEVGERPCNV